MARFAFSVPPAWQQARRRLLVIWGAGLMTPENTGKKRAGHFAKGQSGNPGDWPKGIPQRQRGGGLMLCRLPGVAVMLSLLAVVVEVMTGCLIDHLSAPGR